MKALIEEFVDRIKHGSIEIYNEFSLQHELGILIRERLCDYKVQFERNVDYFFGHKDFQKKEIDISAFKNREMPHWAVELKYPRNGQYPEAMYSICKDVLFLEQLRRAGFEKSYLIVFADDPLFYSGSGDGIYEFFRKEKLLCRTILKPTGNTSESIMVNGEYKIAWKDVLGTLKYCLIEIP